MRNVPDVKTSTCGTKSGIFYDRSAGVVAGLTDPEREFPRAGRRPLALGFGPGRPPAANLLKYRRLLEIAGFHHGQSVHADPPPERIGNLFGRERRYLGLQVRVVPVRQVKALVAHDAGKQALVLRTLHGLFPKP